jgi:hypothetical protein
LSGGETESAGFRGALHEPYAHLYVGDYFADTLDLTAAEHVALRLLLLETWVRGPVGNVRLASVAGLTKEEWQAVKPAALPLLRSVQPRIAESFKCICAFDGQRLPSAVPRDNQGERRATIRMRMAPGVADGGRA